MVHSVYFKSPKNEIIMKITMNYLTEYIYYKYILLHCTHFVILSTYFEDNKEYFPYIYCKQIKNNL